MRKKIFSGALAAILLSLLLAGCSAVSPPSGEAGKNPPTQPVLSQTVVFSYQYANMGLKLPADWEHKTILLDPADAPNDHFGTEFWPEDQPALKIRLLYYVNSIGLCGTGVTIEDVSFNNGLTATQYCEGMQDNFWFCLIYHDTPGTYVVESTAPQELWDAYTDTIAAILESVTVGENLLSETEAIAAAAEECTIAYDSARADFDYNTGVWQVRFSAADAFGTVLETQTIQVDAQTDPVISQ